MIRISGLGFSYGPHEVLRDLSLEISRGESLLLEGDSGSGKTTLLRLIAGLERPSCGMISIDGQVVSTPTTCRPPHLRGIGMVFQTPALYPNLSVEDNIMFALGKRSREQSRRRVDELLALVELEGLAGRTPAELSGGQAHRVALARALAPQPAVLLLDEAFSHLPGSLRTRMQTLVDLFVADTEATVIQVSHDDPVEARGRRRMILRDGRLHPHPRNSGTEDAGRH